MDWTTFLLAVVVTVAVTTAVLWVVKREPRRRAKRKLPVVGPKCGDCARFNLAAGQAILRRTGAFAQVMHAMEPWEYMHPPYRVPHAEYEAVEKELQDHQQVMNASDPKDAVLVAKLQSKRDELTVRLSELEKEAIVRPGPADVPEADLKLKWEDWGHCGEHRELRVPYDTCPSFVPRELSLDEPGAVRHV